MADSRVGKGLTILLVSCALITTGLTIRREFAEGARAEASGSSIQKDRQLYAQAGHVLGPSDAPVTIVEFSDFQCPFCAKFTSYVDSLRTLGVQFRVVYRHLPSPRHQFAMAAVRASECASTTGQFEQMHDALFERHDSIGTVPWTSFAVRAGIADTIAFKACIARPDPIQALVTDTLAARRLGVTGTPTLLINDLRLRGLPSFDSLRVYVLRAAGGT